MLNLLFDYETLDVMSSSIVLSFGAVMFDFEQPATFDSLIGTGFYRKFDVKTQRQTGRTYSQDTLDWWKKQGTEAKMVLQPSEDDITLDEWVKDFNSWVKSFKQFDPKKSFVWTRGNNFDPPILENIYFTLNKKLPFSTWKYRDVRTFIDVLLGTEDGKFELPEGRPDTMIKHHSLHDSAYDALVMKRIFDAATKEN